MGQKSTIRTHRGDDFSGWYQEVIRAAELAEPSPVRGCMVIRPYGYSIWENIQLVLDAEFKKLGVQNAYFPLLIPLSFLEQEAKHVEGFAKECAVVTHHRLEYAPGQERGRLIPKGRLEEPLVIRPTSETIVGWALSRWVSSYRDLPIKINQWTNVMRWEMRTRMFLRTSEFLWQEGHTAFATEQEAREDASQMIALYDSFLEHFLAIPAIVGEKTPGERFPGAESTYAIETLMQDGKALQAGTSHFLGTNFSKSSGITFLDDKGREQYAWTTSWGVSTRLIGAIIMSHGDDDGIILPPRIAPLHVMILPIFRDDNDRGCILNFATEIERRISSLSYNGKPITAAVDRREHLRGGDKFWQAVKKGIPLRVEVGVREVDFKTVALSRRDASARERSTYSIEAFLENLPNILDEMQHNMLARARARLEASVQPVTSKEEFVAYFKDAAAGLASCYLSVDNEGEIADLLSELKVSARCMPLSEDGEGRCIFTGKATGRKTIFGKAY